MAILTVGIDLALPASAEGVGVTGTEYSHRRVMTCVDESRLDLRREGSINSTRHKCPR
jgi:hypothetical protein